MPFNSILQEFHFHPNRRGINCVADLEEAAMKLGMKSIERAQGSRIGLVWTLLTTAAIAQEDPVKDGCRRLQG